MTKNTYQSLQGEAEAIIKEKGSKFIGYSRSVTTAEEAEAFLAEIRSLHPKARHHCYAWRMGHPEAAERANDDGEPSGTAGKPILGQLIRRDLTDAMIVVVRYFGGTLLGTSGLIQAYRECADAALSQSQIILITEKSTWTMELDFAIVHILEEWAHRLNIHILEREHRGNRMTYTMEIDKDQYDHARINLIARLLDVYVDEVDPEQVEFERFRITG